MSSSRRLRRQRSAVRTASPTASTGVPTACAPSRRPPRWSCSSTCCASPRRCAPRWRPGRRCCRTAGPTTAPQRSPRPNGAALAGMREHGEPSLSPTDLLRVARGTRLVLPSPNGAALALAAERARRPPRARRLPAQRHRRRHRRCGARRRRADRGDRRRRALARCHRPAAPGVEDLLGAGAVLAALDPAASISRPGCSPEAAAARAAFVAARPRLVETLLACASGTELRCPGAGRRRGRRGRCTTPPPWSPGSPPPASSPRRRRRIGVGRTSTSTSTEAVTRRGAGRDGAIDGAACGSSTTNSVRCAGEHVLAEQHRPAGRVGGDPLAAQHRRPGGHAEQLGDVVGGRVGADRLGGAAQRHAEQLVERAVARRRARDRCWPSSAGHHTVTTANGLAVGEVEPADAQHLVGAEDGRAPAWPPARRRTRGSAARRRCPSPPAGPRSCTSSLEPLAQRLGRRRTSRSPGATSTRPSSRSSSSARRTVTRLTSNSRRQVALARQQVAVAELGDAPAQIGGDLLVADRRALSHERRSARCGCRTGRRRGSASTPGISSLQRTSSRRSATKRPQVGDEQRRVGLARRPEVGLDAEVHLHRAVLEPAAAPRGEDRRLGLLDEAEHAGRRTPAPRPPPPAGMASCTWSMPTSDASDALARSRNLYYTCLHRRRVQHSVPPTSTNRTASRGPR